MRHQMRQGFIVKGIAFVTLVMAAIASGQEPAQTISIAGRGKVKVLPTTLELSGVIAIEAELAGDALTKFLTAKQSAKVSIEKLAVPNLTVEMGGFTLGPAGSGDMTTQMILNRSRGVAPEPPKLMVQESIRLRVKQIDKIERDKLFEMMAKVVDALKESGVTFGPPTNAVRLSITREENQGLLTFLIDDPSAAREEAESLAMQDARVRGERMAKLAGRRLGNVHAVRENLRPELMSVSGLRGAMLEQSAKFEEIEISSSLQVDFRLLPSEGK